MVRVVLIDPSVHGALGADEGDDGEGHSLEGSETRKDMSEDCQGVRFRTIGGHPGVPFIRTTRE